MATYAEMSLNAALQLNQVNKTDKTMVDIIKDAELVLKFMNDNRTPVKVS